MLPEDHLAKRILYLDALLKNREKRYEERWLMSTANFVDQVKAQLQTLGWTQQDLSIASGIALSRLSQILSPSKQINVTLKVLHRITEALDCSLDVRMVSFGDLEGVKTIRKVSSFEEEFTTASIVAARMLQE